MDGLLAPTVFENVVAAGRAGANHSEAFNAGVLGCLKGRLDGVMPLHCQYQPGTKEHDDFLAGVAEGRALSPVYGAPFGMDEDE
jgi:hypothetical protein